MQNLVRHLAILSIPLFLSLNLYAQPPIESRPNFLIIMVDDLGFSDIGCYGSEIDTPNLDALARCGVRFSQFYNTAKCHSSRVSLLTGQYCMAAGNESLQHAVTSAEVLQDAGYFTAMTGKWHLDQQPTDYGFDRYFGHLSGACNYFVGDKTFRLNGEPWTVPQDGFYTTVANVDYAIDFLGEARKTQKPWYLYIAFNAPHAPLQALAPDYKKYQGRYDNGWDEIRSERVAKQKSLGILPDDVEPSPRPEHIPAWDSMSNQRKEWENKRMTTLAAMIDRVDQEIGRLLDNLHAKGELENTLVLFVSDNGACPYDRRSNSIEAEPTNAKVSWSDSTGWAWARNTPFRYYKQNQFEGGISTPAIVHWPKGLVHAPGSIIDDPAHLIDVMPTLADLGNASVPASWPGRELRPVSGISLSPALRGAPLDRQTPLHFLFSADRAIRCDDWKLVSFKSEAWELYNLENDRCEQNDLSELHRERVQAMEKQWTEMTRELLHTPKDLYRPVGPAQLPHRHREWTNFEVELTETTQTAKRKSKSIRARKNTIIEREGNTLKLSFSGDDPGLAIDSIGPIAPGPYMLSFKVKADQNGDGEVFYTTDPNTILPKAHHVTCAISASKDWQQIKIPLATEKQIYKLRIDVCDGPGTAMISELKLSNQEDQTLMAWPQ